jgi:hypothetical protein
MRDGGGRSVREEEVTISLIPYRDTILPAG